MNRFQILKMKFGSLGYFNKRLNWELKYVKRNKFVYAKLHRERFKYMYQGNWKD